MKDQRNLNLELAVGNESLQEFENQSGETEVFQVAGENNQEIEELNDFEFYDHDWFKLLDQENSSLAHIESSLDINAAKDICGRDDRVLINSTKFPFKLICRLIITAKTGKRYLGSGFFISPRCIITSGHCVHVKIGTNVYDWAKSITVIPGANGDKAPFGFQQSTRFRSVNGWVTKHDSNYDHAAIILPDNTLYNRVKGFFGYKQLNSSSIINNSGYPADKPGNQWFNAGRPVKDTGFKLEYMLDTKGGQSGSPVYIKEGNSRTAIGVHGYGACPNKCIKVQGYMFQRWGEWRRL